MPYLTNGRPVSRPDAGGAAQKTAAGTLESIEPILVTRPQAAELLSISVRKLDEWANRGLIRKWKLDGVVRFAVDDLRAFVASQLPEGMAIHAVEEDPHAVGKQSSRFGQGRGSELQRSPRPALDQTTGDGRRPSATIHTAKNGCDVPPI